MKKIFIGGYCSSGSSTVLDYFRENENIETLDGEQRFIVDPNGLLSLSFILNNNPTPYEVDLAVRKFLKLIHVLFVKYSLFSYSGYRLSETAVLALQKASENMLNRYFFSFRGVWLEQRSIFHYIFNNLDRKLGIDISKIANQKTYCLRPEVNCESFFDDFIEEYLTALGYGGQSSKFLVLDEPYMSLSFSKLEKLSNKENLLISVHRDPRGQFLNVQKFRYHFVPRNVKGFVEWFKMQKKLLKDSLTGSGFRLDLSFEDLVLDYDNVTQKINNFVGCQSGDPKNKKKYFNPDISRKNIWQFDSNKQYAEEIKYIEKHLEEYLYF